MQTVIHERHVKIYREEPEQAFGFSGRACYALGLAEPNYPVPAIPIECNIGAASVFFWWSSSKYKDSPRECKVIWKR